MPLDPPPGGEKMIQPAAPRAVITSEPDRMTIAIPSRRSLIVVLMLGIWCAAWVAAAFSSVASDDYPFGSSTTGVAAFACFWALSFAMVLYALHRVLSGGEVIAVDSATLTVSPLLVPFSRRKTFDVAHVRDLRATPVSVDLLHVIFLSGMYFPGLVGGHIAFDYGAKTYRFGAGVDEAEAKQIVKQIIERYPSLAPDNA